MNSCLPLFLVFVLSCVSTDCKKEEANITKCSAVKQHFKERHSPDVLELSFDLLLVSLAESTLKVKPVRLSVSVVKSTYCSSLSICQVHCTCLVNQHNPEEGKGSVSLQQTDTTHIPQFKSDSSENKASPHTPDTKENKRCCPVFL